MVIQININSRKGASKIISLIVLVGLILSALAVGLVYYPEILQNKDAINDESDDPETPSIPEPFTEPSSESDQGNLGSIIDVLSTNIIEWHHILSDYRSYQIQFRIKNIGNDDLEIEYVVVDTFLATEKSTDEIQQIIDARAISENYLTEIQNKIIPFGGETSFTVYTENLQNETEHTIRLHFDDNEDYMFNTTTKIDSIVEYPKYERVSILSAVCTKHHTGGNWTITMKLKNSGTATSRIISIFINDMEIDAYNSTAVAGEWTSDMTKSYSLTSGQSATIKIYISSGKATSTLSSGTTINVKLHSAGGMDYIKLVELV